MGSDGVPGLVGLPGEKGVRGIQGSKGLVGSPGVKGTRGPPGQLWDQKEKKGLMCQKESLVHNIGAADTGDCWSGWTLWTSWKSITLIIIAQWGHYPCKC